MEDYLTKSSKIKCVFKNAGNHSKTLKKGWNFTLFCSTECLFDSLRPINNLSVKQGQVFLG